MTWSLLVVAPHPDDESIACGGVLARSADQGIATAVVTCTGGEEGDNLGSIDLEGQDIATHRRRELAEALDLLKVTEHVWLGYRDSGMAASPGNDHPDAFHQADLDEAAGRLATVFRRLRPDVVISDDERGTYGHPDHIKAHQVTRRAVELAADPQAPLDGDPWQVARRYVHALSASRLRAFHHGLLDAGVASPFGAEPFAEGQAPPFGVPDEAVTTRVDLGEVLDRKRAATLAHRSQVGADSFFLNMPAQVLLTTMAIEEFVLEEDHSASGIRPETDLFAGLRADGDAAPDE